MTSSPDARSGRWGVLLVNLGSPKSPEVADVRSYLREFLSDPLVVDLPAPLRQALLRLVILPFRPRRSAAAYRAIWTEQGSPLVAHGRALARELAELLPGHPIELAMRYGEPAIAPALRMLAARDCVGIVVVPLFPQYSMSAWHSAVAEVFAQAATLQNVPALQVVPPFFDRPGFLDALAAVARPRLEAQRPDRVLISFHGLPERHVQKSDITGGSHCLQLDDCCARAVPANRYCYRAQCYATARGIAARLGLEDGAWEVAFQSRLGRTPWIRPFTDERLEALPGEGARKVAVLCPSFVADCLETLEEIGMRGKDAFEAAGGEELRLVPSLNAEPAWVEAVAGMVREHLPAGARAGAG